MSKQNIFYILETDTTDPGSEKSGEYFFEHAYNHLNSVLDTDREGIIEALREWTGKRTEFETMQAVDLAAKLGLVELIPEISKLGDEIRAGKIFYKYYTEWTEKALEKLNKEKQ